MAVCLLPVMIATLVAALQGLPVHPYAWWGAGAALAVASGWTTFDLQRSPAEIHVSGPFAAVRSVWACARGEERPGWQSVLDLRDYGRWCFATIGLESYALDATDWPEFADLRDALRYARDASERGELP